jgi:beta-lactamase regulating signal transducer with metallopeptidase domain
MSGFEVTNFAGACAVFMALNGLWLGTLIAALAAILIRLLPRPNAATRYAIWFTALVLVLASPALLLIPRSEAVAVPTAAAASVPVTVPVTAAWPVYAGLAWLAITIVMLARVIWSLSHIHGLKRRAALLARRENISVLASSEIRVPMAAGFFRRAIIFPQSLLKELSSEEFEQVLCHEMAHLRRGDDWSQLLQEIGRAVFFFNPAIHWIGRRLTIEREMACDDWVIASTGKARPYAACLTHLHELMRRSHSLGRAAQLAPGAANGKRRQITTRVEALLEPGRNSAPRFSRSGWMAAFALASTALIVVAKTTPPVAVGQLPLATLAMALPNAPAAPVVSLTPRAKVMPRPRLLAHRMGPELPAYASASGRMANSSYLPVRAWQIDVTPTYLVITVVFFEPPPQPTALHGI